jgi:hypothetical protein
VQQLTASSGFQPSRDQKLQVRLKLPDDGPLHLLAFKGS